MSPFRSLTALTAASFAFALSAHCFAYCLTTTCDPKKEACSYDGTGCNIGGKPLYWASSVVTWDVQRDGSQAQHISAQTLGSVVQTAFQKWEAAKCGGGKTPSIHLQPHGDGLIDCAKPEYNQKQPNANVITFHDSQWPYTDGGAETNTLALTTVFFSPETGEIYDANVEINSNQQEFVVQDGVGRQVNLNAVLTHELGHFLGLSHSPISNATMFSSYEPGMDTLEADDEAAICASLPPDRAATANPEPRHGFSGECASAEKGCCSSTIGGKAPVSQSLGLWAFGLGVCAWLGRGRRARRAERAARSAQALRR